MPFTIAHAAAVLPLRTIGKTRLPLSALMIGSMAPDFAYFVPPAEKLATHSLAGLFWFCWPVGFIVWLLFVRVLERPSIALLPDAWRTRLAPTPPMTARLLGLASAALIVGAATHIVWDSFTHVHTVVVDAFPPLREITFVIGPAELPLYHVLQILSSIAGLVVLAFWGWWLRSAPAVANPLLPPVSSRTRWTAVAALAAGSCLVAILYAAAYAYADIEEIAFHFLIGGMTGCAIAWCGIAVWVNQGLRAETG